MSSKKQRLELTWTGKDDRPRPEPRILLEDLEKSYLAATRDGENDIFENKLIFGDNLLALKALEQEFSGKVKCIFIDPPYNTGNAFEYYDDGIEHSLWLTMMRDRLEMLKNFLTKDGVIFIQIDDTEQAYLRVLMDEVFGRNNFINTISVKMKNVAGVSGGGEDKKLKKNVEYIHIYTKNYLAFPSFKGVYSYIPISDIIRTYKEEGKSWKYTTALVYEGDKEYIGSAVAGDGSEIKIYSRKNAVIKSINQIMKDEGLSETATYDKYANKIFQTAMPQSSIRPRVMKKAIELGSKETLHSIEYFPKTGRNKGRLYEQFYKGDNFRLFAWLRDVAEKKDGQLCKKETQGTYWNLTSEINNLTKEGSVSFPNGKKPEALIHRIIHMATDPGDLILDSFGGSGTTGAVAHKMGRRWIMVERGEHCHTHCIPRLQRVIDGTDQGGISKAVNWKGGGGFRYYRLAPSMLVKDKWDHWVISKEYNACMLAEAMCKHMGFTYAPDEKDYWMQGRSTETDFIYVTTRSLTYKNLHSISADVGPNRTLLICCKAFKGKSDAFDNLTLKKIPESVLEQCEWGKDDYSSQIANLELAKDDNIVLPLPLREKSEEVKNELY